MMRAASNAHTTSPRSSLRNCGWSTEIGLLFPTHTLISKEKTEKNVRVVKVNQTSIKQVININK